MPTDTPPEPRNGRIITFYSYKGGTGRTMALANVAWILAANGHRVLVADWDLESPGLHRFYQPFLDEIAVSEASGIIDLIRQYEQAAGKATTAARADRLIVERARVQPHVLSLNWEFPAGGSLEYLSAGRQNLDYQATLAALDWDTFYEGLSGGQFLDAVRDDMKHHYDYVLIDSRTGLSDIAGICTRQLPDILVDCFTLSTQGIEGAAQVARLVERRHKDRVRILPVPMRVDQAEKEKVEAGRAVAIQLFAGLPAAMSPKQRQDYWAAVEVPYQAFYAYEETLAVFGEAPGSPASLLSSFERLTAQITDGAVTGLPPMDEQVRTHTKQLFTRRAPAAGDQIIVEYGLEDEAWGEWIADVVRSAGIAVLERPLGEHGALDKKVNGPVRTLIVVSAAYLAQHGTHTAPDLTVYVTPTRPPGEFSAVPSAFIAGVPEKEAVERLHRVIGIVGRSSEEEGIRRYPGTEPKINTAPAPNIRFTGREKNLRELRKLLSDLSGTAHPVNLQGLGGVGKTQLAIEYVHRFKNDYDLIWWLDCGQPQFIDASLADLGARMRDVLGIAVPATEHAPEVVRQVLDLLGRGREVARWLLVFDNAEYIDAVRSYLPSGGGDVLITSRHRDWAEHARQLQIEVFSREESIAHLRKRIASIDAADANHVADVLGDLPLAVATAGAWLAETGTPVAGYVRELESRTAQTLALGHPADYEQTVPQSLGLSLNLLRERSPAAARLFELCSTMAPNIAIELLNSSAMAKVLEPLDPELAEPMVIGRLIREVDRLALIKLDHNAGRIQIHRVVQDVVRDQMSADEIESAQREVHRVLAAARPSRGIDNPDTWDRYRMLWPHLEYSQAMTSRDEDVRQLFIDRVRYIWLRRDLERGRLLAAEAETAWEEMLASASEPGLAESLRRQLLRLRFDHANILRSQARFAEAKTMDESVLAEQREMLGFDHPHTLMTAGGMAADLRAAGSYRDALEMDKETYPAWMELYGDGHPRTLMAANNLAVSYRLTGEVSTALRLDRDTFQRRRATLGAEHPHTLGSATNVVRDLLEAGQYTDAAARAQELKQSCTEALSADSVEAMTADILLGIALRSAGQPTQAEPHFQALEGLTTRLGSDSSDALAARLSHAVNLLVLGRATEAEAEINAVKTVYEHRLGSTHPHTLVCLVDLACALRTGQPNALALETVQSAADGLRGVLGEDHPYTLAAMSVLGVLLADQGELARAEQVEKDVVNRLAVVLGSGHPDTLRTRANLLLISEQLGVPGAAAELERTIDDLVAMLGSTHPHVSALRGHRRLLHTLDLQPF